MSTRNVEKTHLAPAVVIREREAKSLPFSLTKTKGFCGKRPQARAHRIIIPIWAPETIKGAPVRSRCQLSPLSADRGSELSHGRRDASRGTAEMRNDLLRKFIYCDVSAPRAQAFSKIVPSLRIGFGSA